MYEEAPDRRRTSRNAVMSAWVRRWWPAAVAVPVLLLAGAGIAYASIPDSGGVIHGCYGSTGNLRVINGTKCPGGQASLNWYQAGGSGQKIVYQTTQVPADGSGGLGQGSLVSLSAGCPSGYAVTGGGFVQNNVGGAVEAQDQWVPVQSYPIASSQTWNVQFIQLGQPDTADPGGTWTLQAYAVCLPMRA